MAEFVPIPDLREHETDRVDWHVQLPNYRSSDGVALEEGIAVNVTALNRAALAAGFTNVSYVSVNGGVDRYAPNVSGHAGKGQAEATAGLGVSKTAAAWGSLGVDEAKNERFELQKNWSDTTLYDIVTPVAGSGVIRINTDPLHQRLSQSGKLHNTKAWAHGLNRELKRATCLAAVERLAGKSAIKGTLISGAILGYNFEEVGGVETLHGVSQLLALTGAETLGLYAAMAMFARGNIKGTRFSIVIGAQIDRIMAVGAVTGAARLAKPL
jgi:hypothetical protein